MGFFKQCTSRSKLAATCFRRLFDAAEPARIWRSDLLCSDHADGIDHLSDRLLRMDPGAGGDPSRLAQARADGLDLDNLAEEVVDLGKSQRPRRPQQMRRLPAPLSSDTPRAWTLRRLARSVVDARSS
jgi:hypothetical protein